MKFRSFVLVTCMLVVPLLAMFSHKIPAELRGAIRTRVWKPAMQAIASVFELEPQTPLTISVPPAAVAVVDPVAVSAFTPQAQAVSVPPVALGIPANKTVAMAPFAAPASQPPATIVMPIVTLAPIDTIAPAVIPQGKGLTVPGSIAIQSTVPSVALAPQPLVPADAFSEIKSTRIAPDPPVASVTRSSAAPQVISAHRTVEEQLVQLGAVSFECLPPKGAEQVHRCSCRVAADPTGQLQRVFQSADAIPSEAMNKLLTQVTAWKRQIAAMPSTALPQGQTIEGPPARF
ncbi:MAG: hypothetical protein WCI09_07485 [Planctomycetota bacterium]